MKNEEEKSVEKENKDKEEQEEKENLPAKEPSKKEWDLAPRTGQRHANPFQRKPR